MDRRAGVHREPFRRHRFRHPADAEVSPDSFPDSRHAVHPAAYGRLSQRGGAAAGAVVVVGSGQSGCQIAEDLLSAGRTVYLCTSKVGRAPRRYRGRDLLEWWVDMKRLDVTFASLEDKSISRAAQPQISGLGRHGHTVSLQQLARQGAVILGRLLDVDEACSRPERRGGSPMCVLRMSSRNG